MNALEYVIYRQELKAKRSVRRFMLYYSLATYVIVWAVLMHNLPKW